jgi:hypothetical protein
MFNDLTIHEEFCMFINETASFIVNIVQQNAFLYKQNPWILFFLDLYGQWHVAL